MVFKVINYLFLCGKLGEISLDRARCPFELGGLSEGCLLCPPVTIGKHPLHQFSVVALVHLEFVSLVEEQPC